MKRSKQDSAVLFGPMRMLTLNSMTCSLHTKQYFTVKLFSALHDNGHNQKIIIVLERF